jgi:hypothetical protein
VTWSRMSDEEFASRVSWLHRGKADRYTQDKIAKEAKRARKAEAVKDAQIQDLAAASEEILGALMLLKEAPEDAGNAIADAVEKIMRALRGCGRLP